MNITNDDSVEHTLSVMDYDIRICVAGSRTIRDRKAFDKIIKLYLERFPDKSKLCFISGDALNGPDRMIIQWAKYYHYPCFKYRADWDNLGKRAGYVRNAEMRGVLTHLLALWDGVSKGTKEMVENTKKLSHASIDLIVMKPDPI